MKHFNIKSVIVKNTEISFSGTLIQDKYILVTSHLINIAKLKNSKIEIKEIEHFWVIQTENDHYTTQKAFLIGHLGNENIKNILKKYFNEIYDWPNSSSDIGDLFTIYVLSFDRNGSVEELKDIWHNKYDNDIYGWAELKIADEIFVRAAPFGSRQLINSYFQGIVSNHVHGILLTDCPTTYGCEGGLILSKTRKEPLGIVVSSMAGWRGEWTGLTLGITFELLFENDKTTVPNGINGLGREICTYLVYVKSGVGWGTGICIDKENRIILTNAHVITNKNNIEIIKQTASTKAKLIFKVPEYEQFDLALLKYENDIPGLQPAKLSRRQLKEGEQIFSAGFPLFPHGLNLQPSITKGHVSLLKPNVLMTTCTVLPGLSGGALFDMKGHVLGIVTCNIMNKEDNCSYPRLNMNIPSHRIAPILDKYLLTKDVKILNHLILTNDCNLDWSISKL